MDRRHMLTRRLRGRRENPLPHCHAICSRGVLHRQAKCTADEAFGIRRMG